MYVSKRALERGDRTPFLHPFWVFFYLQSIFFSLNSFLKFMRFSKRVLNHSHSTSRNCQPAKAPNINKGKIIIGLNSLTAWRW
nr:MAG TPA: Sporulation protein YhaL [Caudoviricetes sp.]